MSETKVVLVVGAGEGLGASIARRFAAEGYHACVARRNLAKLKPLCTEIETSGGRASAFALDASDEAEVVGVFERIERDVGAIEVAVHNIEASARKSIRELTAEEYQRVWQLGCYSGFLVGREAARRMVPRGRGSLFFTGATASLQGRASSAAFATSKFGLRALAQSLARELGPQGVHVAHVVIDGGIDSPSMRERFQQRLEKAPPDVLLSADAIAANYWALQTQPRSAWSFELDLRPWVERW